MSGARDAQRIIEQLRRGIPPIGSLEHFTVGREDEIRWLDEHLDGGEAYALLLKANYGSGKSHLLELIREKALRRQCLTSLVVLDSKSGVRFNRMDQIFGAIMRGIRLPETNGKQCGLAECLDFFVESAEEARTDSGSDSHRFWAKVSNNWKWDYSEALESPPLYVALRAWAATDSQLVRDLIVSWLSAPADYASSRKRLYESLVADLRRHFRDPRGDWQFYADNALSFSASGSQYQNCWSGLEDVHRMSMASGLKGMAIMFDEFEDVLTNLAKVNWKESAFWNLFRFVSGDRFSGKTFFAVTPAFVEKCKHVLMERDRWDFDYSQFDALTMFEMSPLGDSELQELAERIIDVHEIAYDHNSDAETRSHVKSAVQKAAGSPVQDRARQAIKSVVQVLDGALE